MKRMLLLASAALVLSACARSSDQSVASKAPLTDVAPTAPSSNGLTAAAGTEQKPQAAPANSIQAPSPAATPMLAYSYDYAIEAPPPRVRPLVGKLQSECVAAGPAKCQVVGSNIGEAGRDQVTAKLELKATPVWLTGYADRIAKDAADAGGRLTNQTVTSEDLSRQIVDTEAAVRAKTTLRDRLQSLLETRSGALDDLLKVEEELATVQGDLDATNSELAVMRERVATSDVTIEFSSAGVLSPQGSWSPIPHALSDVSAILAASIAAMI